jgi:hypothetical protein
MRREIHRLRRCPDAYDREIAAERALPESREPKWSLLPAARLHFPYPTRFLSLAFNQQIIAWSILEGVPHGLDHAKLANCRP